MLFHSTQYSNLVYFFFQQQADLSFEVLFIKMEIVASIWNCLLSYFSQNQGTLEENKKILRKR